MFLIKLYEASLYLYSALVATKRFPRRERATVVRVSVGFLNVPRRRDGAPATPSNQQVQ